MSSVDQSLEFVRFILDNILSEPEKAIVTFKTDEKGEVIEVQLPEDEMGKLIGKGGKTAQSIRYLLNILNAKSKSHIYLKILEPLN